MNSPRLLRNAPRARLFLTATFATLLFPATMFAPFHTFEIREIFTNANGSVQFIELFNPTNGQNLTAGQTITVDNGTTQHVFTFNGNTPDPSGNHAVLIGTSNLSLFGVTPDFVLSPDFLFTNSISIIFNGTIQGQLNFSGLPTDGMSSLMFPGNTIQIATPQNYAGVIGTIPEPAVWSLLGLAGLGLAFVSRRRAK